MQQYILTFIFAPSAFVDSTTSVFTCRNFPFQRLMFRNSDQLPKLDSCLARLSMIKSEFKTHEQTPMKFSEEPCLIRTLDGFCGEHSGECFRYSNRMIPKLDLSSRDYSWHSKFDCGFTSNLALRGGYTPKHGRKSKSKRKPLKLKYRIIKNIRAVSQVFFLLSRLIEHARSFFPSKESN